ncbi:hypothetical protein W97_02180 [Coniosporium apollinis CBS 100218]|uniref:DUF1996 domain-containing protein n=1 Tax=Coniosporium apollinis (strain CBS 100218) TaxID=1168221 RepID=R7YMB1_CONA1|nr:uncharacterized protein W97_02180 [Coniosporium apollinis CBS 100218]EON62954.1 hypothetical protein W97_02180 [Coniosporium apollinis CBS 100218]
MVASNNILSRAAVAALTLSNVATAFWRMPCHGRTGLARIDPLVDTGEISDHAHSIHGGSNFGFTASYDDLMASDCTSCSVKEDKSAYWTPSLHFMYANGTTVVVPQVGGMLSYYLLYGENVQAFPAGFRMLAGDGRLRNFSWPVPDPPKSNWSPEESTQFALSQKALGFNCLNYKAEAEPTLYRHFMPDKKYLDANCADGLRLELFFPSCWNGKDLDTRDHKSHMAYSSLVIDGNCPSGFETRLPSLLYETIWATQAFKGAEGQFVLSNGDPTGYGYHGDFINAWDIDFLQRAVDTCTNPSGRIEDCPLFTIQDDSVSTSCKFDMPKKLKDEDCAGPGDGLCGNVPIQSGPDYASHLKAGKTESPSLSELPSSTVAPTLVPTLSYTSGGVSVTDSQGGGIVVPAAAATVRVADEAAAPIITAPAMYEAEVDDSPKDDKSRSTSRYTSGGAEYHVVYEEEVVTVTATTTQHAKRSRHIHHRRNHGQGLKVL